MLLTKPAASRKVTRDATWHSMSNNAGRGALVIITDLGALPWICTAIYRRQNLALEFLFVHPIAGCITQCRDFEANKINRGPLSLASASAERVVSSK